MKIIEHIISFLLIFAIMIFSVSCGLNETGESQNETTEIGNNGGDVVYPLDGQEEDDSFVEKEQPELSEESKALISAYQKNPTEENYLALRESVIKNYNSVLAHKESKLAELRVETFGKPNGEAVVAEMDEIVQDMYVTYWEHINSSMLRFTDSRLLRWKTADAARYDYIPVMGAGQTVYISRTPVTNAEYKRYLDDSGHGAPSNWVNGDYPTGEDDFPVNFVSNADAQAYCDWLSEKDADNLYRLPNESEWELAAGHMPKDAEFNCSVQNERVSVYNYDGVTRGAHGAIDFWGNVWEWTSTARDVGGEAELLAVKGGSYKSERTECRTEYRKEGRDASIGYEDVGFRVIRINGGIEPTQKVELATLAAPIVTAEEIGENVFRLNWQAVPNAVLYQVFEYDDGTQIFKMSDVTTETTVLFENIENTSKYRYVVQAVSYVEFSDNVSSEFAVGIR